MTKRSSPQERLKVLLLEGVHPEGVERLEREGFAVEARREAWGERELMRAIEGVSVLGLRSQTTLSARALAKARRLLAVGAYCIGTDRIDLAAALSAGVPVFNAPFANTRSVAELVIADIIMLFRRLADRCRLMHGGAWEKSSRGCSEVRGKTLGIVGYGHIGSQVSVLAEAMGMQVIYVDIVDKLSLGNAVRIRDLRALLERSDCVTLHVPETPQTRGMIGRRELAGMKRGAFLVNTSRGSVVDAEALAEAMKAGRLGGAAIDVFANEPKGEGGRFASPLVGLPNAILTPHIGGATAEAQRGIGREVSGKLARFITNGSTEGAVNFPNVVLPEHAGHHRILHIHRNIPGVMQKVNTMFGRSRINIEAQLLRTQGDVGYLIMDTNRKATREMVERMRAMPETIKVRALF